MSVRRKRTGLPEDVAFPVTPFLDMAFQLLAFFILTFRPPSGETRVDLYLPTAAATLPAPSPEGVGAADDADLDTDLIVRVSLGPGGAVTVKLGETRVADARDLEGRLRSYAALLAGQALRVRLEAPDALPYEEAARLIGACSAAGVSSIRLGASSGARP